MANKKTKTKSPKPGQRVRGSATGRPIMVVLDLLGRRWALRILWELRDGEPATFRTLRARCDDVSPTVLNTRLGELRDAGILEHDGEGYRLTGDGADLLHALEPIHDWSETWAKRVK